MRPIALSLALFASVAFTSSLNDEFLAEPNALNSQIDNLSCLIYDSLTVFNMKALQEPNGYSKDGFRFNFCQRFNITNS
jgi:hypothetical protein